MQKPLLGVRISQESMDRLHTLMNTRNLKKPAIIEAALELLYNDKKLIVHPASQTIADEEVTRNQEAFKETLQKEIRDNVLAEPAFHLKGEFVTRSSSVIPATTIVSRYRQQGEMAGVKEASEKINMRAVMGAFRNKVKGRTYDKEQEQYFDLLTFEFRSRSQ